MALPLHAAGGRCPRSDRDLRLPNVPTSTDPVQRATTAVAGAAADTASDVAGAAAETAGRAVAGATQAAAEGTVSAPVAVARGRSAMVVAVAGLIGFGAIFAAVRAHRSEAIDLALMLRLQRQRRPWLDRLMSAASWPGFPPQSHVIPPAAIAGMWLVRFRTEAAFQTAAWGTAALSTVLKALMNRPRPVAGTDLRVVVAPLGGSSFPSGHVITFVGTYGFMAYLAHTLIRDPALRLAAAGGLVGLVVLVGPSRIYQGHHWPTDVTASYLLGTTYLIVVVTAYRRMKGVEATTGTGPLGPGPAGR
jgi:membrane-associated phospholipid phosphatase